MTVETKTTIELSDIGDVQFECKNCGFVATYPLRKFRSPPTACGCHQEKQWMTHGGEMYAGISQMVELMRRMSNATSEPFTMRFGLRGALDSAPASDSKV